MLFCQNKICLFYLNIGPAPPRVVSGWLEETQWHLKCDDLITIMNIKKNKYNVKYYIVINNITRKMVPLTFLDNGHTMSLWFTLKL